MQKFWLYYLRAATVGVVILTFFTAFAGAMHLPYNNSYNPKYVEAEGFEKRNNLIVPVDSPTGGGDTIDLPFPIEDYNDPTNKPRNAIDFDDPSNINQNVEYDPETGQYIFTENVGDYNYRNPSGMTLDEYLDYDMEESKKGYWRNKVAEQNKEDRGLIPPIKIKGDFFKNVFGSDEINIRPQGTAELSFGINSSKYDNPQIPEKQRRVTTFDFNQRIQLNVVGQIGEKLKLTTSYNTEATFDFQNNVKLEYTGFEDEIIQKIEMGNVSMPLNTSLINGAQSLFGVKTHLRFGKLDIRAILSQQRGQRQEINITGGAKVQDFEVEADDYEANKHYFLNFYHRNNYNKAMASLPVVSSNVKITKIEVWVTNRRNNTENTRNILAFSDLGESDPNNAQGNPGNFSSNQLPRNESNGLYEWASNNPQIRAFNNAVQTLAAQGSQPGPFNQAVHYEKVENARRLAPEEYSYNALLGFISLNQPLNQDEVLGVAYQYTYQGETFQVGEFSTDGITGQDALLVKLLKPTILNPKLKVWDLMMKNVYAIGAYQLSQENFRLQVMYNNPQTSTEINYMPYDGVNDRLLVQLLDMDRLNQNNQQSPDGTFDFAPINFNGNEAISGGTINPSNGRVYFSTIEPFGATLDEKMATANPPIPPQVIDNIAFHELYDSTKIAARQIPSKNRFKIKGSYKSSVSDEIYLNALNIPEGSVKVTAGGVQLQENVDYTVDYNLGRVKILNQGILESQQPIKISLESNQAFGFQQKSLFGTRLDYRFSKDFNIGATLMNLSEKPLTGKVNLNDEPINNTVIGADINYRTDAPFLTKIVDAIPLLNTKAKSTITASAEFAYLIPGTSKVIKENGGTSYIDDFEGSQSAIDIRSFSQWRLASVPQGQPDMFPEGDLKNDLAAGYNRARLAWYVIDPLFHQDNNLTPDHIKEDPSMLDDSRMRLVLRTQLFPQLDPPQGSLGNIPVFDLAYYPSIRGQYNMDVGSANSAGLDQEGKLNNPESRWGGIMRSLNTTNFEQANIEYIQFWMLDPFNQDADPDGTNQGGDLYFNLGNVSEDILPDSRKSFENGLPISANPTTDDYDTSNWARVPTQQVVVNAFDNNNESRIFQDIGLDGFNDEQERLQYQNFVNWVQNNLPPSIADSINKDPANDNYQYFRDDDYDRVEATILERYVRYNGMEGNSPTSEMSDTMNDGGYPTQASNRPDVEDINQDNNLSEAESYFQYRVSIRKQDLVVGQNYITNSRTIQVPNTNGKKETWYQFKIPVRKPDRVVNGIQDFRSIRFIRMFMNQFDHPVVLRFARLELIRGAWRRYEQDIISSGPTIPTDPDQGTFNISALNVEENDRREPIPYVIPPGIERQQDVTTANLRQLNEQSLVLDVCGLQDGNAKAAYKNVGFDIRSYKKMRMFVHGEAIEGATNEAKDDDVTVFVRLGTDFTENYYEYEMPVKITGFDAISKEDIWPTANNMEITFSELTSAKRERNLQMNTPGSGVSLNSEYIVIKSSQYGDRRIKVKGSPNLQGIKMVMIGVRNPKQTEGHPWQDDGLSKCVNIWVNEMRLTDFDQSGGWATTGRVTMQMADFANISLAGSYSTPYWGSLDAKVSDRQRDTRASLDIASTFQMGQFFGDKANIQMPLFVGYSVGTITPEYDPLNPDILFDDYTDLETKQERLKIARDFTERTSVNLTNVRRQRPSGKENHFWDIENISLNFSYGEVMHRDFNIEYDRTETWRAGLNYTFNGNPKLWEPFKNMKGIRSSKWLKWLRDFNIYLGPKVMAFNGDVLRTYNERKVRNVLDTIFEFEPTYLKNFQINRTYNFKYDISKSIKFDFNAVNNGIFTEPDGKIDKKEDPENYQAFEDSIQKDINTLGRTMHYGHNMNITVNFPFSKIPILDWINATGRYSSGYDWQRAPLGQDSLGNVIQNNRMLSINAQMNFTNLYNKIDFFKRVNQGSRGGMSRGSLRSRLQTDGGRGDDDKKKKKKKDKEKKEIHPVVKTLARILMTVRNASGTYTVNDGTMLPGYNQETMLLGFNSSFSAPTPGFIFGEQNTDWWGNDKRNFAVTAAENGWIVDNENLNTQHTINHTLTWNGKVTLEPFKDLRIDVSIDRNNSENKAEYYRYSDSAVAPDGTYGYWEAQNTKVTGMLTFSTISLGSAFEKWDDETYASAAFQALRDSRSEISTILGENAAFNSEQEGDYYSGYGPEQQDVIIGAFLTTYTALGTSEKSINPFKATPLPNWSITYDGLSKFKFMKKIVRNFSITHSYRSTFTLANYQTNLLGGFDEDTGLPNFDQAGNFIPELQSANAVISEQFSPLVGFDATWTVGGQGLITKFEWKKDRNVALSLANNQITEVRGNEIVIGAGYKFPKVKLPFKLFGKPVESALNIRVDLTFRENVTVIRKIVENSNQATAGQNITSIKTAIDYNLSENLNIRLFYDQNINNPVIGTSYPSSNINAGLALRINLAQ